LESEFYLERGLDNEIASGQEEGSLPDSTKIDVEHGLDILLKNFEEYKAPYLKKGRGHKI